MLPAMMESTWGEMALFSSSFRMLSHSATAPGRCCEQLRQGQAERIALGQLRVGAGCNPNWWRVRPDLARLRDAASRTRPEPNRIGASRWLKWWLAPGGKIQVFGLHIRYKRYSAVWPRHSRKFSP